MSVNIKLNCTMNFSAKQEKDMVEFIENMKSQHKFGNVIGECFRVCWDNREKLRQLGIDPFSGSSEVTDIRARYFREIAMKIDELRHKVNKIYDAAFKTYMLAMFNKQMGLEDKSKMNLSAQYALERQIDALCNELGTRDIMWVWESNKKADLEERAKNILDYIVNTYDGVVNEIVEVATPRVVSVSNVGEASSSGSEERKEVVEVVEEKKEENPLDNKENLDLLMKFQNMQ